MHHVALYLSDRYQQMKQGDKAPSESETVHYIGERHNAPSFSTDNEFIKKGYRINFNTPKKIIRTLFMVHNETLNIWTHLLGAFVVLAVLGYFMYAYVPMIPKVDDFRASIKSKFNSYINDLHLSTLTNSTGARMTEATDNIILKYGEISDMVSNSMRGANATLSNFAQEMEYLLQDTVVKLIEAKERFENQGVKSVMSALDRFGQNQTYFQDIKGTIKELRDKFISKVDSPVYDFIDFTQTPNIGYISRWPVVMMMCSAIICLLCSATFHLFYPMSSKYYMLFARFDYAGINILISGSTIPALYYGLYCRPVLAQFYIVCISIIATSIFVASLFEFMHTEKFRTFKSICYGAFGIIVSVPMFHILVNEIWFSDGDKFTFVHSLPLYLALGSSYIGGLVVYTKRCPQRHRPGSYDICGHSHQIWHMMVILGIFFTYLASLQNFEERKRAPICPAN